MELRLRCDNTVWRRIRAEGTGGAGFIMLSLFVCFLQPPNDSNAFFFLSTISVCLTTFCTFYASSEMCTVCIDVLLFFFFPSAELECRTDLLLFCHRTGKGNKKKPSCAFLKNIYIYIEPSSHQCFVEGLIESDNGRQMKSSSPRNSSKIQSTDNLWMFLKHRGA